jgi:Protein of unknown function (DUF3168)
MFENGLYELLTTDPGVSGKVGTEVYFAAHPKSGSFPTIIIHTLSTNYDVDLTSTSSLEERRLQINYISSVDQFDAREGERAVEALLKDYGGTLPDGTVVSTAVINSVFDLPYEVGAKSYAYGSALDISLWITEATS